MDSDNLKYFKIFKKFTQWPKKAPLPLGEGLNRNELPTLLGVMTSEAPNLKVRGSSQSVGKKLLYCSSYNKNIMSFKLKFSPCPKPEPKQKKKHQLNRTPIKKKFPKATGEASFFLALWKIRPHNCFVAGQFLGDEMKVDFFFHILPKSIYKKYRLRPENIIFTTPEVHYKWHNGDKNSPEFKQVNELYEKLKQQYNREENI